MDFEIKVYSTYDNGDLVWYAICAKFLTVGRGSTPGEAVEGWLKATREHFDGRLGQPW